MANYIRTKLERKSNGIKIENAIEFFRELERNKVSSGIHREEGSEYVKRAAHTELGSPVFGDWGFGTVPPRPAIRMTLYPEMMKQVNKTYCDNVNSAKRGNLVKPNDSAMDVLDKVGDTCQYLQQKKMIDGGYSWEGNTTGYGPEHNGERTILFKGFDDPWINTTETLQHVNYKVSKA